MAKKPSKDFLDKTMKVLNKRFEESKKLVDSRKTDWERWRKMYHNEIKGRSHDWEANLVIPKAFYIVQTVTPQILSTIFQMPDFLTIKNPAVSDKELIRLGKWFVWFLMRKMNFYMKSLELFTETPITGTSILKLHSQNGIPTMEYMPTENFYPDPRCRKPGDIDSMQFCFHHFKRDLGQLERAVTYEMKNTSVEVPGQPDLTGAPTMETIQVPKLEEVPLYFNLENVWAKFRDKMTETEDEAVMVELPSLDILEHWGEIETTFGIYDMGTGLYKKGVYEEYIVTCVLDGIKSGKTQISDIIRCEPSKFSYEDRIEDRVKYLKPFVSSLYTAVPDRFYGIGAIEPVESMISEMKEHHDLYLDEHKRSVMTVLSVLQRSGLGENDLPFSPYAHWYVRSHEDVLPVKFPEVNLQAFQAIHGLIDREIDRTTGSSTLMQGVPTTKRQTASEIDSLLSEASKRFVQFIQTADHLTLRPIAFKTLLLMRNMPAILRGEQFTLPDEQIVVDPKMLTEEMEFDFVATGVESEYTKYAKQQILPKLLKELAGLAKDGKYEPNLPEIVQLMSSLFNFKDIGGIMQEKRPAVPVDLLKAATDGDPQLQQALQQLMDNAQMLSEAEQENKKGGKPRG